MHRYTLYDHDAMPDMDLNGSCPIYAEYVQKQLRAQGYSDVTVIAHPDEYNSWLEVDGLPLTEEQTNTILYDTVAEIPDELVIMQHGYLRAEGEGKETTIRYRLFDAHVDTALNLVAACHIVAQVVEAAIQDYYPGATVTAAPNGIYSEILVKGFEGDPLKAWYVIDEIVLGLPDEVWMLKEGEG